MTNGTQNTGGDSYRLEKLNARTMESDKKSIHDQGGSEPKPYNPPELKPEEQVKSPIEKTFPPPTSKPQEPVSEDKDIFQPPQIGSTPPPKSSGEMPPKKIGGGGEGGGPKEKTNKKLFMLVLAAIILVGIITAAYFLFVRPSSEEVDFSTAPSLPEPEKIFEIPTIPAGVKIEPAGPVEEAPIETGAEETGLPETPPIDTHSSLLNTPADLIVEAELTFSNLAGLRSAVDFSPVQVPILRELVLRGPDSNLITFGELMKILAPSVFTDEAIGFFESDFTLLTYADSGGTWLGLVVKTKTGADLNEAKARVSNFENRVSDTENFFMESPGALGEWKDGAAGGISSRYVVFEKTGAAFNYGWNGNILIIATSYSAFQEVAERL